MLKEIRIKNYALIEDLVFRPGSGLNVITGETGSGKSILLEALGLVLGDRADLRALRNPEERCVIEAVFDISAYGLKPWFEENELDFEDETIIRREILNSGKSRAFVNDTPVPLQVLRPLGEQLVSIHSQHESSDLLRPEYQLWILDVLAGQQENVAEYRLLHEEISKLEQHIYRVKEDQSRMQRERDFKQFQFAELDEAQLKTGELEELEAEAATLSHAEGIRLLAQEMEQSITEQDHAMADQLARWHKELTQMATGNAMLESLSSQMLNIGEELRELSRSMQRASDAISNDPERLQQLEERINRLHELSRKYHCQHPDELMAIRDALEAELAEEERQEGQLAEMEQKCAQKKEMRKTLAEALHEGRKQSVQTLSTQTEALLQQLGMPYAVFEPELEMREEYTTTGKTRVRFLFSANKGMKPADLSAVASGGERSRLMLALKTVLAGHTALPTMIFDEIDTGVSGAIATAIAVVLKTHADERQMLCITHSPQVAAAGIRHFKVAKHHDQERTYTELIELNTENRVFEIAQMLSGNNPGETALSHARALLK